MGSWRSNRPARCFPFRWLGSDFDNDSACMKAFVVPWCRSEDLQVTRSRVYQMKIKQTWGKRMVLRRLVRIRFAGAERRPSWPTLCGGYGNLFQRSFRLQDCRRGGGARVIKRYYPPVPSVARVLAHPEVAESDKKRLRPTMENAEPVLCRTRRRVRPPLGQGRQCSFFGEVKDPEGGGMRRGFATPSNQCRS